MPQSDSSDFKLCDADKAMLLQVARRAILSRLYRCEPAYPAASVAMLKRCGAFVTLHAHRGGTRTLRGCIGYTGTSYTLIEAVKRAAVRSAFFDGRFPPLQAAELPTIRIEISVLSPIHRVQCPGDIQVGRHGVLISCDVRSGLLLPQVATEFGWDAERFFQHACLKAGLPRAAYLDPRTEIYSFTAIVFEEEGVPPFGQPGPD